MKTGRPKITPAQSALKFKQRINKNPTIGNLRCWVWTGSTKSNGYGQFSVGNYRTESAHRFAYELWRGKIPDGLWVLHRCDNKWCVNPKHLFLGTAKENTQDAKKKGRLALGERHHKAKMSDNQIVECRAEWESTKDTRRLAVKFGVNRSTIQRIINNQTRVILAKSLYSAKGKA